MPPKSAKMSKAEKERKMREEEERRRIEEEEERIRAIQEERERKKRERLEAEEKKKRDKEELIKRAAELEESRSILGELYTSLAEMGVKDKVKDKWDRYMLCDGSPDPGIPQEINTFINLWREDSQRVVIEEVLHDSELGLRLVNELDIIANNLPPVDNEKEIERCQTTSLTLQKLLREKLDRASHEMLCKATALADPETANLQMTWKNDHIRLCLWGNLNKNPRLKFAGVKSFEFGEEGISFDIPKVLTMSDCAYRVLFTKYDHFTATASSAKPRLLVKEEEPVQEEEVVDNGNEEEQEEGTGGEGEEEDEDRKTPAVSTPHRSLSDLLAELNNLDGDEEEEEAAPVEVEVVVDIPEEDLRKTPEPGEWEDYCGEEDAIDMRAYHVLGGVFHFNLLQLPPQPKVVNGWKMTSKVVPPLLQPFDYEVDPPPPPAQPVENGHGEEHPEANGSGGAAGDASLPTPVPPHAQSAGGGSTPAGQAGEKEKKDERPPIMVTLKIAREINLADQPQVAHWDEAISEWRTNGVDVESYKEEAKEVSFKISVYGTFALLQDFHINMPFQTWELRPYQGGPPPIDHDSGASDHHGEHSTGDASQTPRTTAPPAERPTTTNHCLLTIIASIQEVRLQVCEDRVAVVSDPEKPELNHLAERWLTVPQLVKALRDSGVNVFPREDSHKYVTVAEKNPICEEKLYEQMALLSPSMAFSWSRWNGECPGNDKILLQACEHTENIPVNEESWNLFTTTRHKVIKLKMREFDTEFSDEGDESSSFHADFYHMYTEIGSSEGLERVQSVDYRYFATVKELLQATRMAVFT